MRACLGKSGMCTESEFRCSNGLCIKLPWKCDAEDDCSDGIDERDCDISNKIWLLHTKFR